MPNQEFITVSDLTSRIKQLLEDNFPFINIIGEISNFKKHYQSGHFYFTLKDENSQIQAVMWNTRTAVLPFLPEDGMHVIIKGRITVYKGKGSYQIDVWDIKPQGRGELQLRFELLKQKLFQEGLFDEDHKISLPEFPESIAVISSISGAALQDMLNIFSRRFPAIEILLFPATVQGSETPKSVINALNDVHFLVRNKKIKVDVVVITRGGGSFEDLYYFNDEILAREIYKFEIPVVSAIGHEVDFTICDFVADLRAPTPSAAAELVTPDRQQLIEKVDKISYFCRNFVQSRIKDLRNQLKEAEKNYFFNRPKDMLYNFTMKMDDLSLYLDNAVSDKMRAYRKQLNTYEQALHLINPVSNLKKGYAIVRKKTGQKNKIISRAAKLSHRDKVTIEFFDSEIPAQIE